MENNWERCAERTAIKELESSFIPQSYSDKTIEIIGCTTEIGMLLKQYNRYCQPNGSFDLNFDN